MKNLQLFDFTKHNFDQALTEIIFREQALWQRLVYLRHIAPNAYLSAGVIRNLVWSVLHGQTYDVIHSEIDVIFFDEHEDHQRITHEITRQLIQNFPENEWDVVNQATVHTWYSTENGQSILPYASLHEALSVWPETATAMAIRLLENDDLEIIAPFGLCDLFTLKLRWNDRLVSHDVFMQRVMSKRFLQRWEKLEIVSRH
ncbi:MULTISPECIES: nucleotidyltransferase family protein [unclassified Acinetobacter]|uniref:nucleotidyltransferase family protein n=1 Tax=unclassified Acinetobacter TaxID=196816 RepID=UPI002575F106|nr:MULTISPECIES: nucleotidyltransferase family protein [unclassified Acinetobacter]MDM1758758.1 nucleotidyltransferase family protein [Acinetobacter sp. 256-1]MDM1762164.1 nucleotidyltransferase family protein [Acinetobacter sp. 251-1]